MGRRESQESIEYANYGYIHRFTWPVDPHDLNHLGVNSRMISFDQDSSMEAHKAEKTPFSHQLFRHFEPPPEGLEAILEEIEFQEEKKFLRDHLHKRAGRWKKKKVFMALVGRGFIESWTTEKQIRDMFFRIEHKEWAHLIK